MCRKISAHVDGGLSGGSRVRRPGSEDPHRRERKFPSCYSAAFLLFLYVVDDYFYFVPIQICVFNMLFPSSDVSNGFGNSF